MKKSKKPKTNDALKYTQEQHHTCSNPAICKTKVHPDETCAKCSFYNLRTVSVAQEKHRRSLVNMF